MDGLRKTKKWGVIILVALYHTAHHRHNKKNETTSNTLPPNLAAFHLVTTPIYFAHTLQSRPLRLLIKQNRREGTV